MIIAYNGTHFNGWQKQATDVEAPLEENVTCSVQFHFEQAVKKVLRQSQIVSLASGRTDAGVHALAQHVQIYFPEWVGQEEELAQKPGFRLLGDPEQFQKALNASLPEGIVVIKILGWMPESFHVQRSALAKHYVYRFQPEKVNTRPFRNPFTHYERSSMDRNRMIEAAPIFEGEFDFNAFRNKGTETKSTIRTIYLSKIAPVPQWGKGLVPPSSVTYELHLVGNGFLKQMVRNIMGALMMLGQGNLSEDDLISALQTGDADFRRYTAPPDGLFLVEVFYDPELLQQRI